VIGDILIGALILVAAVKFLGLLHRVLDGEQRLADTPRRVAASARARTQAARSRGGAR